MQKRVVKSANLQKGREGSTFKHTPKKAKTDTPRPPAEEKRREGGARQAHGGGGERRPEHAERHHGACAIVLPAC